MEHKTLFETLTQRGDGAVALTESGVLSAKELLVRAAAIAAVLPDATPGSEVAFSFEADVLSCAAALLATWSKGHTAALPENGKCENIMPLLNREKNVAFLHDTGVGLGTHVPTFLAEIELTGTLSWKPRAADSVVMRAFLLPPVGEITEAAYTEQELLEELARQIDVTGMGPGMHVVSGLSPSALPALLAGCLSAMKAGGTFAEKTQSLPGATQPHTWIATPAQARDYALQPANASAAPATLLHVDGPLDQRTALILEKRHVAILPGPSLPLEQPAPDLSAGLLSELFQHEDVRDAAIALLPCDPGEQPCALVIVESNPSSEQALRDLIEAAIPTGGQFKLRVLDKLPRDDNGRLPDWRVFLLFRYGRNGAAMEPKLIWTPVPTDEPNLFKFSTQLPEDYAFFEGHYTTYAVLAGAAQIHELAQCCIKLVNPSVQGVRRLSGIKFLARIAPRDELVVSIRTTDKPADFHFEVMRGDKRCSAGRIEYFTEEGSASQ